MFEYSMIKLDETNLLGFALIEMRDEIKRLYENSYRMGVYWIFKASKLI